MREVLRLLPGKADSCRVLLEAVREGMGKDADVVRKLEEGLRHAELELEDGSVTEGKSVVMAGTRISTDWWARGSVCLLQFTAPRGLKR